MSLQSLTLHKFKIRGSLKAFVEKNLFWKNAFYFGTRSVGKSENGNFKLHNRPLKAIGIFMFNIKNMPGPNNIIDLFTFKKSSHNLRPRSADFFHLDLIRLD